MDPTSEGGPVSRAVRNRPPLGPIERLDHDGLVREQQSSLRLPRRRYSVGAQVLFRIMDVVYGRGRSLEKFRVLELVARVPYQAWENVAYVAVTHTARQPGFARRVFDRVRVSRWEQDNEQWHLLILEELTSDAPRGSWLKSRVLPQVLAFVYYQLSWVMFAIRTRSGRTRRTPAASGTTSGTTTAWPTSFARSATTSACTSWRARRTWSPPASSEDGQTSSGTGMPQRSMPSSMRWLRVSRTATRV